MAVVKRDSQHHTYADYLEYSGTYGEELIDGTAYVREPPSPSMLHQEIAGELSRQVSNALKGKPCRAFSAPLDVRLPKSNEADEVIDTVVQPDVFIVCDPHKLDERGVRGAPDWLAEVLSPSTAHHDQTRKLPVYERAGVREVWLIHPRKRIVAIYLLDAGRYRPAKVLALKGKTQLTAVPGVTVDWDEALADIPLPR